MDWRSILKFDENLYNHTDESTKEKHQKILDFIKDRPKTKGTGLKIKEFLDSGELDESFTTFDLPRNSITAKTKEYYNELLSFDEVKSNVNHLVNSFTNMLRVYRAEIERGVYHPDDGMPIKDFTSAFSKLVKNFYYSEIPKRNININMKEVDFTAGGKRSTHPSISNNPTYKEAVENYLDNFHTPETELLMTIVYRALEFFIPTEYMSVTSSMDIKRDLQQE